MQLQISTLQSQLTLLQRQNRPEQPISAQGLNGADVASCISELRAELHAIKSVVAATPPPASAAASVWQLPPGTGSRHGSRSSRARSHDVPQPAFPIAPSVGRQPSAPSPTHHSPTPRLLMILATLSPLTVAGPRVVGPRPPQDPHRQASAPGSIANSSPSRRSQGIGSTGVVEEADVYRNKDLSLVKIDSLPRDVAQFRGWKNAFVTRLCSIDKFKTGKDTILHWVMPAFEVASVGDLSDPGLLSRLDAHIASLLADSRHMTSELGMQFQAYIEGPQLNYTAPRGRVLLQIVARRFFLDQRRGANLTEQALLELQIDTFSYQS